MNPRDVQLVDYGPGEGAFQRNVPLPVVSARICHHAFDGHGSVVTRLGCGRAAISSRNRHRTTIWIEEDLFPVEPEPAPRFTRAGHAVGVQLPRLDAGDEYVPIMVGAVQPGVECYDPGGAGVVDPIEKKELDAGAVSREEAEVHPARDDRRAQRRALAAEQFIASAESFFRRESHGTPDPFLEWDGNQPFPNRKGGFFCPGKEIEGLRGGVRAVRRTSKPED